MYTDLTDASRLIRPYLKQSNIFFSLFQIKLNKFSGFFTGEVQSAFQKWLKDSCFLPLNL